MVKTKAIIAVVFIIIVAIAGGLFSKFKSKSLPIVAIANWGPHGSLDETIVGIKKQLSAEVIFKILDVNFDQTLIIQTLYTLKANKPLVMVTMGTPITQAAKNLIKDTPIVFADVTNPKAVGLDSLAGVSDRQDLKIFIDFVKKLIPHARNIGLLYATSEANDTALVNMMKLAAAEYGMGVIEVSVDHARDIPLRMEILNGKVDLIYVGVSGTIQPSLPAIVSIADRMKIPVFNAHENAVLKHYVVGSFGVNYYKIGNHVAEIIKRILHGENVKNIKIIYPKQADFQGFVSKKRAAQFGITLPINLDNITVVE